MEKTHKIIGYVGGLPRLNELLEFKHNKRDGEIYLEPTDYAVRPNKDDFSSPRKIEIIIREVSE